MNEPAWPDRFTAELERFPAPLRALLTAELAAGNEIIEAGAGFPAPPVGGLARLKAPISTRAADAKDGLVFRRWPNWNRETGFTDAQGFFFVLNPPPPPPSDPGMDAIRASADAPQPRPAPNPSGAVDRFQASMVLDYEKWHDGIGYDLEAIESATNEERASIERIVLGQGAQNWRDIEALVALGTPRARKALRQAFDHGKIEIRMAVLSRAPDLVNDQERTDALVEAIRVEQFYGGLTEALDLVEGFHPPPVIDALFRGTLVRAGEIAVHFAALLYYIHGKAQEPFDWGHRPFFLQFHTEVESERVAAFHRLCADVGVAPARYLDT